MNDIFRLEGTERDLLNVPVAPVSLVNDIAGRFRQAVISGSLKPGDEINGLSPEKILEIMTARAVIESYGARVLAQQLTPDKVRRLWGIWERLNVAAEARLKADLLDQKELDGVVGLAGVIAGTIPANHSASTSEPSMADVHHEMLTAKGGSARDSK